VNTSVDQPLSMKGALSTPGEALIRPVVARQFLGLYADALDVSNGRLALFSLPGAATLASRDLNKLSEEAARRAERHQDVYFHIHLHDLPEGDLRQRGSLDTVRAAIAFLADIDARGPGRKKPPATLCPTVADAIAVVQEFDSLYAPLRASLIVGSGHGCYPAILLKEPLLVESVDDKALLESLGRRYHKALHDIASKHGWTGAVDYCDPAKVLRLPGCANYKDANNPRPVQVLYESESRFTVYDLDGALPSVGNRSLFAGAKLPAMESATVKVSVTDDADIEPLVTALRETHPLFGPTWDNARPDLDDQSCSGYDMALAGIGVGFDLTDQQIAELIVVHRRNFPREKKHRQGSEFVKYLERTIAKARTGRQPSTMAEENWAALEKDLARSENHQCAPAADTQVFGGVSDTGGMERASGPVERPSATAPDSANHHHRLLALDPGATPPFEKFDLLCEADRKFRLTWDHRRADLEEQTQPAYDQTLANAAARAHWTDSEVASLVIANRRKFGVELEADQEYYRKTIALARELAEPVVLDHQLAMLVEPGNAEPVVVGDVSMIAAAATEDGVDAVIARPVVSGSTENTVDADGNSAGSIPSTAVQPTSDADMKRAALLKLLSARFKVPIKRIIRFTGEPSLYRLETDLGDVQLSGVAGLINQSKLRISVADATGRYLPQIDPETWPSVAQALLDACESVDRGQDATLRGAMGEWLRAYLSEKSIHVTLEKADEGREPFMDNGAVVIFTTDFKRWLQIRQNERVTQGRLTADLRTFGAEPGVYKVVSNGKPTTRSAWRLPHGPWIPTAG
jgi:hypothetical protein